MSDHTRTSHYEALVGALHVALEVASELVEGFLNGAEERDLKKAAFRGKCSLHVAVNALYWAAMDPRMPEGLRAQLNERLDLANVDAHQLMAAARNGAALLSRLDAASDFEVVDLTDVKGAEA